MARHSKKRNGNGLSEGEAAAESRFSHFVDDDEGFKPFAEIKALKPHPVPPAKRLAPTGSPASARPSTPSSTSSVPASASSAPSKGVPVSSGGAGSKTAPVTNKVSPSDVPSSGRGDRPQKKNIVGGFDPSVDFGDILRQWEATGDPYALPGKNISSGHGVGRRLKKDKAGEGRIGKLDDPMQTARKAVQSMDFGQILAQWEAEKGGVAGAKTSPSGSPRQQGDVVASKSRVVTTGKDFAQILAEWEASQVGKNVVSSAVPRKDPVNLRVPVVKPAVKGNAVPATSKAPDAPSSPTMSGIPVVDDDAIAVESIVDDGRPRPVWSAGMPTKFGTDRVSGGGGFADVYDRWAAEQRQSEELRLEQAIAEKEPESRVVPQMELSKLRQMLPQVTLDLHGLTAEEAERRVREFLSDSHRNGMRKVCVIHGKGLHAPQGQGVLKEVVLREIERSKVVREYVAPSARYGGSGVLWLILKN